MAANWQQMRGRQCVHIRSVLESRTARPRHRPRQPLHGLRGGERSGTGLVHVGHGVIEVDRRAPLELPPDGACPPLGGRCSASAEGGGGGGAVHLPQRPQRPGAGARRGVALLAAAQAGLPVHEYAPARVKKAVGAGGAAARRRWRAWCALPQLAGVARARRQRRARGRPLPPAPAPGRRRSQVRRAAVAARSRT